MEPKVVEKEFDFVKTRQQMKIPGYAGHCPKLNSLCGTTYGNATKRTFVESEKENACTSRLNSLFRRTYSEPSGVSIHYLKKANSSSRPFSASVQLPYSLSHTGKRRNEVLSFNEASQLHRKHYQDLTGKVHHVPSFTHRRITSAPPIRLVSAVSQSNEDFDGPIGSAPHNKMVSFVKYSKILQRDMRHPKYTKRQPSAREKQTRDVYFERR